MNWRRFALVLALFGLVCTGFAQDLAQLRKDALESMQKGNWKDAYESFEKLCYNEENGGNQLVGDFSNAVNCLRRLNRVKEVDDFREKVVETHDDDWRVLAAVGYNYLHDNYHYGFIIGGEFERGPHRGGKGRVVNVYERDRVRALQLMTQALPMAEDDEVAHEKAQYYFNFAGALLGNRGYHGAWLLQAKTDLGELPDYTDGYGHNYGHSGNQGAPVDAAGNPVFHAVPKSWEAAETDGERWRYLLTMAQEVSPQYRRQALTQYAGFLYNQFGTHRLLQSGYARRTGQDEDAKGGILTLHTLSNDETVTKLANGVKRFEMPGEHNFIRLYRTLADEGDHSALTMLGTIYENRRQFDQAVKVWQECLQRHAGDKNARRHLDQLIGNWGNIENLRTTAAGQGATFDYRFRNGDQVTFTAREVKYHELVADVRKHLQKNPKRLQWQRVNFTNVGRLIVQEGQTKWLGDEVAKWSLDLEPADHHYDRRINVDTPLQKAGVYLVEGQIKGGNTSRALVWVDDVVIARKQGNGNTWYYVADANTGKALANAKVSFFGYVQEYIRDRSLWKKLGRRHNVLTREFEKTTDENGQVIVTHEEGQIKGQHGTYNMQFILQAEKDGKVGYYGFDHFGYSRYHQQQFTQNRVFIMTDRPVYRPDQTVKFKAWLNQATYNRDDVSPWAGQQVLVRINNPKGEKVIEEQMQVDEWGGVEGEVALPKDATLGVYYVQLPHHGGSQQFRVEEYKKPEFEVTVDAPTEPIKLGDTIEVTVRAKYYFGAPVAKGKAKIKVLRSEYSANWYPYGEWDWFYGRGYWWFAEDYAWYPGFRRWGCFRPMPFWHNRPNPQPELVMEQELDLQADGTVKVEIDTAVVKELFPDDDHNYSITAEVTDESRRTIVGNGSVVVASEPFKVYAWVDRGFYHVNDTIKANFSAQTVDNRPVAGTGVLKLLRVSYDQDGQPEEKEVRSWKLDTDAAGKAEQQLSASEPGQYRLSYTVTDAKGNAVEGGYLLLIRGKDFNASNFAFNELEIVPEKKEYQPGEKMRLMVNTDRRGATVVLFLRPANGVYLEPQFLHLEGKSTVVEVPITKADMPNFFVEAMTIYDARHHQAVKSIAVPPEKRVLNVQVKPDQQEYGPGKPAKVKLALTDFYGEPYVGTMAVTIYDKSVEYISGGSNVPEIKSYFWKWTRNHWPQTGLSTQYHQMHNLFKRGEDRMGFIGAFGHSIADDVDGDTGATLAGRGGMRQEAQFGAYREMERRKGGMELAAAPMAARAHVAMDAVAEEAEAMPMEAKAEGLTLTNAAGGGGGPEMVEPTVRTNFADTAYWQGTITTDVRGEAEIELTMPENLTSWKIKTWAMGKGCRVGEGSVEVVTTKNVLLRLQAPRFFVEKDLVMLSANVHNYLEQAKEIKVSLETNDRLALVKPNEATQTITVGPNGEQRVDWPVTVTGEGEAMVRMKALTDEESDAMEMMFPAKVHGMNKTVSFSGHLRPEAQNASITFNVPAERRINDSRLEVRYSPTLAGAMVDALPYLVSYPYGCTEQTLNRFLPSVIVQKILLDTGIDLEAVRDKQANLNAQEIGDDQERAAQWKRNRPRYLKDGEVAWSDNPVFDRDRIDDMVHTGVERLGDMQLSDGGWGWFSGWGEHSYPHTTAYVVHGLQTARWNDAQVPDRVLDRGLAWLKRYQNEQVRLLKNAPTKTKPYKTSANNLDAFVFMVLVDADIRNDDMLEFLYRDRLNLSVYGKCMVGIACHNLKETEKRDLLRQNIEQFLVKDEENQTAWLELGNNGYWWYWYGSEWEAHAYYLKLLAKVDPKGETAPWLVKYLLNNRRHATYWNSTRDTALCIEAFADYMRASKEDKPDMTLEVYLDGKKHKEVKITADNLFSFDNKLVLTGDAIETGEHKLEFRRQGTGPLYFNAYVDYFSLEDFITRAGLEVKVERKYFKLIPEDKTVAAEGAGGAVVDKKVEKYRREELANDAVLESGDLVEIELVFESKNDYEYVIFEDMKAAGFEPMEVRSGYSREGGFPAYREFRDDRVSFFVRQLPRGKNSLSYRMRAEIPGRFSALPTKAYAMYAPELKGNSDEIKLIITDPDDKRVVELIK